VRSRNKNPGSTTSSESPTIPSRTPSPPVSTQRTMSHPDGPVPPSFFFVYTAPVGVGKPTSTLSSSPSSVTWHTALAMASSGIAALLMGGGSAFHPRCKPPKQPYVDGKVVPYVIPWRTLPSYPPHPHRRGLHAQPL
jgi:hypothetical protein